MGLQNWKVDLTYHDGPYVIDGAMDNEAVGSCLARWQYQTAHLQFNTQETAKMDDGDLEQVIVHELSHALVNEMRAQNLPAGWSWDKGDTAHEERVVTNITNAILWAAGKEL